MIVRAACLSLPILATCLCALWVAPASASQEAQFDVAPNAMEDALVELSRQADVDVLFLPTDVEGLRSQALHGRYSVDDALRHLIGANHLCFQFTTDRKSVVVDPCGRAHEEAQWPRKPHSGSGPEKPQGGVRSVGMQLSDAELESVVVTGSHIPRKKTVGPDVISLKPEDFARYGFRTLADLSRVLTQIFGGGPSQDTHQIGAETQTNSGLGSAINLRALGAPATLVLINGRRLAPSGTAGAFVDISNIPLSAIERVDILADGVSAIYGADSVAGVVNIITRSSHDEDGKPRKDETSAHFYAVTQGVWRDGSVAQTLSKDWMTGGVFASAEQFKNTALPARDRSFSNSDLRYFGGPNLGIPESWPPTLAVGTKTWAVPQGVIGKPSTAQLVENSENLLDAHSNSDLLPQQEGARVYGQAHQSVNDLLTITMEALQTLRRGRQLNGGDREDISVPATSPYYLPQIGNGAPILVERDLFNVLGPEIGRVKVQTSYGATIVDVPLGGDRSIEVSASRALETEHQKTTGVANMTALSDPKVDFDPFADRSSLGLDTLAEIQGSRSYDLASELHEYGAQLAGPIVASKAGRITGALGAEYRTQVLHTCDNTTPGGGCDRYGRRIKAAFLELVLPLLGQERAYAGLQALELSAAGRYEDYSDFGHASTPRFGFRWAPMLGLEVKGSWGKSIRVPSLPDLNTARNSIITGPAPSGTENVIFVSGNNAHLKEERARTGMLELNYTQEVMEDSTVSVGADFFDIHYFDRIQSVTSIGPDLLTNPKYDSVLLRNPPAATVEKLCDSPQFFGPSSRDVCRAGQYAAVVDLRLRNIDTLLTRGLDFNGSWQTRTARGGVGFRLSGTYLLKYSDRATPTGPEERLLDTQNNPIRLQAHGVVDVRYVDFGGGVTVNFSNGYRDTMSVPSRPVGSWTTVDLQVWYEPGRGADSVWDGVSISVDVQNVANLNPPFLSNYVERLGYDEENADPLGRVIGVHLRKRW